MKISTLSRACAMLSATLVLAACSHSNVGVSSQVAPGTAALPVLSADEAAHYTEKTYFAFGGSSVAAQQQSWYPTIEKAAETQAQYVVGPKGTAGAMYTSVQQALNAALRKHNHGDRIFIKIMPGTYTDTVYIPAGTPPVTLSGTGETADQVVLQAGLEASVTPAAYRNTVNANGQFLPGDRAWYMFNLCAKQNSDTIGTGCSASVWSQSNDLQVENLTIANSLQDSLDAGDHSAVALRTDGDRAVLENVHIIGRQNTLMVNTGDVSNKPVTNRYHRVYVHNSLIAGDVDYVFGQADAVFDHVEFHTVSSRGVKQASIFAPNTPANVPYGFLVINSNLTADKGFTGKDVNKAQLGRAWDAGVDKDGYVANQTANSQLVIRDSQIDGSSYDLLHPWGNAAFSDRPFSGNIGVNRDLNDANFNRLWQYNNVFTGEK